MTQTSWDKRWNSHEMRYVGVRQFQIDIDDAKRLATFFLQQSKDRIDVLLIIPEFHALVDQLFPENPIFHALMDQIAYKGMTIPVIIANTISSYPSFGWMHLFANNAVLRGEITTLMKFFQLIKGDVYAGFRVPGVATSVKNLAYLCVKLQSEVGGDEQIRKYNGIGGLQNTTPIPLKSYSDSLVEKFKSSIGTMTAELPDASAIARYDMRYQRTKNLLNEILAKYLHPTHSEGEDRDVPDNPEEFQPFDDDATTSSSDGDDDDRPPRRGLKRLRSRSESLSSRPEHRERPTSHPTPRKKRSIRRESRPRKMTMTKSDERIIDITETAPSPTPGPFTITQEIESTVLPTVFEFEGRGAVEDRGISLSPLDIDGQPEPLPILVHKPVKSRKGKK
jgi:hypothetical protein